MRNIVKFKLSLLSVSLFILLYLFLSAKNFYINPIITKWRPLNWQDFQGFVKPFTGFDAAIHSNIYLEYDSSFKEMRAYAGQDITRSWKKRNSESHDDLLRHEQYHFNLTEVFARKFNHHISLHPNDDYNKVLANMRSQLSRMQDQYDYESNHSTVIDQQHYWEYKIDSMLHVYSSDSGSIIDYYSGAKILYSSPPEIKAGYSGGSASRSFTLRKYNMDLKLKVVDIGYGWEYAELKELLMKMFASDTLNIVTYDLDVTDSEMKGRIEALDTLVKIYAETQFHVELPFVYIAEASYPALSNQDEGYRRIQDSFLNSFAIVDTESYWLSKVNPADSNIFHYNIEPPDSDPQKGECLVFADHGIYGFVGKTFFSDDGDLFIPYLPIDQPDSAVMNYMANINDEIIDIKPSGNEHFFHIPNEIIPDDNFEVFFGHTLKKDSVEVCWQLYYHHLIYEGFN